MRSVVVTGGTTRIGAAIAEHLETLSWHVIRSSHRNDAGADIVADLSHRGGAEELYAAAV